MTPPLKNPGYAPGLSERTSKAGDNFHNHVELALSGNINFSVASAVLTDNEALSVVGNSYSVIPQNLMYEKGTNKTRKEIILELLSNDPRSKNQVWTLELKKKKRGPAPRCRACRRIQNENELTVNVKGLYVPHEQNFVTETMIDFCPKQQCMKQFRIGLI